MKKFFTLIAAAFALSANAQLADGDYFIKNVETGKYLNGGNSWGTKASVTTHAQIMTVAANDGKYSIDSHISNGGGRNFLAAGDNTFVDAAVAYHNIDAVADGYSIMDANGKYFVSDGNVANFNGAEAQAWKFITKAEYIAEAVAKAKAGEQGDLTGLVPDANFSRNNQDYSLWIGESKMGKGGPNDAMGATATGMNAEKWGGNSTSIDFGTKIEGLPNGKYTLKFQGFYRYNNTNDNTNDVAAAAHADGTEQILANFIVNNVKVPFLSIADEASVEINGKMPFSQAEACEAFTKGAYQQEFDVLVTDGTLSLQVLKNEADHLGTDWTILDNIELYLLEAAEDADYTVYAKVTADEQSKTFTGQEIKVSTLSGVATVTLPAAQAGPYKMESQSVKVNIDAEGKISMVEGQTIKFTGAEDVVVTVTGVEGTLAEDKVNVTVTGTGDNGKDVKVVYSTDPIVDPQPETVTLTKEMFKTWTSAGADAQPAAVQSSTWCDYVMNESTGMPYGNGNVDWMQYADLTEYESLSVIASEGTPRFFLNRLTANGQAATGDAIDTNNATHFANYVTKVDNGDGTSTFTLNVAKIVEEQGFAHLNVIKGGNWANVTVTSMELVKAEDPTAANAVVAAKAVSVAKFIENGQVVIVKNGKKYNMAGQEM